MLWVWLSDQISLCALCFFPKEHNHKLIMTTRKNKNDNDNNHNENNKHDSSNDNSNHNIMITLITPISQ